MKAVTPHIRLVLRAFPAGALRDGCSAVLRDGTDGEGAGGWQARALLPAPWLQLTRPAGRGGAATPAAGWCGAAVSLLRALGELSEEQVRDMAEYGELERDV